MEQPEGTERGVRTARNATPAARESRSHGYTCNICQRSFSFQSSLSQHMRKHMEARPYKCPYCNHRTSQKGQLKVHIRSHRLGFLRLGHEQVDDEERVTLGKAWDAGISEGLNGCTSPTKSTSTCHKVVNGHTRMNRSKELLLVNTMKEEQLHSHLKRELVHEIGNEARFPEQVGNGEVKEGNGAFPCKLCAQSFTQAWTLEAHMKKHFSTFEHGCPICGQCFREAWFLTNHMKTHFLTGSGRAKSQNESELPATINGVPQAEATIASMTCLFQLCFKCGNFFHDKDSLQMHNRVHSYSLALSHEQQQDLRELPAAKKCFLEYLNLKPTEPEGKKLPENNLGKRIPELDPVCSYQAWQLATKGRMAETSESRGIGGEDASADPDVVYDWGTGKYVPVKQEKRKRDLDFHGGAGGRKRRSSGSHGHYHGGSGNGHSPGNLTPDSLSDSDYQPPSRQSRRSSQGKVTECFECGKVFRTRQQMMLHTRIHRREGGRSSSDGGGQVSRVDQAESTSEADSVFASCPSTPRTGTSLEKVSMGRTRDRPQLLLSAQHAEERGPSQPGDSLTSRGSPYDPPPRGACRTSKLKDLQWPQGAVLPKSSIDNHAEEERIPQDGTSAAPLDLSERPSDPRATSVSGGAPLRHQCSYCSYSTLYPEVLWVHQSTAHKVKNIALVPSWVHRSLTKVPPGGLASWRRTGPPPAWKGKECPALPQSRVARTRPPSQDKDTSHATTSQGKAAPRSTQLSVAPSQVSTVSPRSATGPATGHPPSQEGLGFMLFSKHGLSDRTSCTSSPLPPAHPSAELSSSARRAGVSRPPGGAVLAREELTPNTQADIMSFQKNRHTHDRATIYPQQGSATLQPTSTTVLESNELHRTEAPLTHPIGGPPRKNLPPGTPLPHPQPISITSSVVDSVNKLTSRSSQGRDHAVALRKGP